MPSPWADLRWNATGAHLCRRRCRTSRPEPSEDAQHPHATPPSTAARIIHSSCRSRQHGACHDLMRPHSRSKWADVAQRPLFSACTSTLPLQKPLNGALYLIFGQIYDIIAYKLLIYIAAPLPKRGNYYPQKIARNKKLSHSPRILIFRKYLIPPLYIFPLYIRQ
ncbi:hypothetical protein CHELA20_52846 [Hyphomicrobiales bacterium]|nr:hypothetical protein CHELA41_22079 [Hyphomicrobiales bacterium]CAH1683066.1 hypothetical protein CHELA20_52846 [Hyphomicrobiales bacterium]